MRTTYLQHGFASISLAFVFPIPTYWQNSSTDNNDFSHPISFSFLVIIYLPIEKHSQNALLLTDIKTQYRWQVTTPVHIGLAPSFKLTGSQVSPRSGSIIIKDMDHCPVQMLYISPDIPRSLFSLQHPFLVFPRTQLPIKIKPNSSWRIRIAAPHIPHVLYV